MSKLLAIFVVSALLSAAIQLGSSGCFSADDDLGACPASPIWPPDKVARPITNAEDKVGADRRNVELPFDLSQGTIEVENKQVVIRYTADDEAREVTYTVLAND